MISIEPLLTLSSSLSTGAILGASANARLGFAEIFGASAAIVQVVAYLAYLRLFVQGKIQPNAASWFMFSYGTWLVTFLESRNDAGWPALALPVSCATMSTIVALLCLRRNATYPVDHAEKITFGADVLLTVAYALTAVFGAQHSRFAAAFLVLANITTFSSFAPTVRSTWRLPEREQPWPWALWTGAYGLLLIATIAADHGKLTPLVLYPSICIVLHAAIAILSRTRGVNRISPSPAQSTDPTECLSVRPSSISGQGIHTATKIPAGEEVGVLSGTVLLNVGTDEEPNAIGVARGVWIDPGFPMVFVNHSCDPNSAFVSDRSLVALRTINPDDEITLDYSTTEADTAWTMNCSCGAPKCRGVLRSIQIAFANHHCPPVATPAMQQVWADEHHLYRTATIDLTQSEAVRSQTS